LLAYNPLNEWEKNIESLYTKAIKKIERQQENNKKKMSSEMQKEEDKEVERLKEKWGLL
jgi:hypothetical protein